MHVEKSLAIWDNGGLLKYILLSSVLGLLNAVSSKQVIQPRMKWNMTEQVKVCKEQAWPIWKYYAGISHGGMRRTTTIFSQIHIRYIQNIFKQKSATETRDFFWIKKPNCPLRGATILTVFVHSAVWGSVEMERWLICVNKFFHFALKLYFISKTVKCFWHTCMLPLLTPQVKVFETNVGSAFSNLCRSKK
jgi:hypothetical protein